MTTNTENFTIPKRWLFQTGVTVSIACDPAAPFGVKLGLAVRAAYASVADLRDADLSGAVLRGAVLRDAVLRDADLSGAKITRILASANRGDGYTFYAFELEAGGVKIKAGCRWFTVSEFRAHILAKYPDTDKATETGDILDFIEARCRALGVALEAVK
jgi:hypothetical protein